MILKKVLYFLNHSLFLQRISLAGHDGDLQIKLANNIHFLTEPINILSHKGLQNSYHTSTITQYVIISKGGAESRIRIRRLWTDDIEEPHKHLFIVPIDDNDQVMKENEEYGDILSVNIKSEDIYSHHKLILLSLYWSYESCQECHATVLVQDDVFINTVSMNTLITRHKLESNRMLGLLYKYHVPARDTSAPHYTSDEEWPWQMYPPFLDPHVIIFTQDTLPVLLHHSSQGSSRTL